jgi:uncharacterized protein YbjT (DUF2867 family)
MKVALLAGATGLMGKQLLQLLLNDPEYHRVIAITRKPLNISNQKLENIIADFDNLSSFKEKLKADNVFCCLGTTMKVAKTKEAFRKVDFTYPFELAKLSFEEGAKQFLLVSSLGADKSSSIYYNQVKGEIEEAIEKVNFPSYHIFRPSLLLGPREESRSAEDAAKIVYRLFGFLIPEKYKAIDSAKVARAMVQFARQEQEGKFIHESKSLQHFSDL